MNDNSLATAALIFFIIVYVLHLYANYKLKKSRELFRLQIQQAREIIKEKKEYERRLSSLGYQIQSNYQAQIIAQIYEQLNKATYDYESNPRAVPNPINAALLDVSYNYTIIKND